MRNRTENQITLVMIRHGATWSNQEHRYLGKTEEPLSEEGIKELLLYKERGDYPGIDALFASPMKRCVQTAEILYPALAPVHIKEWTEIDFGAFEGKNYRQLQGDERYQKWIDSNGALPFPEGESRETFMLRCETGFEKMIRQISKAEGEMPETVGLVVHGGTIMSLLSRYLGGDYFSYQAANGKGYICSCHWESAGLKLTGATEL